MGSNVFSPMAIDAIGEIFNISLGSSATAVSNLLARRVDITTPTVSVVSAKDFTLGDLQPAIGVKIDYVAGLSGSNIMLLKRSDVRAIVDILMGSTTKDEDFEINELSMSAICEVMNQMMGAASTAMSDFLNRMVNISTPQAFEIGRTRRRVKDILNYTKGSLVVLDRLAGDRADLYVNGKCIAKGDIVVVDDNFGLRIAEIIEPLALEDL